MTVFDQSHNATENMKHSGRWSRNARRRLVGKCRIKTGPTLQSQAHYTLTRNQNQKNGCRKNRWQYLMSSSTVQSNATVCINLLATSTA